VAFMDDHSRYIVSWRLAMRKFSSRCNICLWEFSVASL